MGFTVGAQTAQGIGTLLGQMFGGGYGQKDYAQGQLVGAQIRERKAKAALDEQQYKSIADAITAGLASNWQAANVNSLYGGHGRTSFDVTNQGAVFNKNTGELDLGNGIAQASLALKQAQARQFDAAAGLNSARASEVNSLVAPKQDALLAQALARQAQAAKEQQNSRIKLLDTPAAQVLQGKINALDELLMQDKPNDSWLNFGYSAVNEKEKLQKQRMNLQNQLNTLLSTGNPTQTSVAPVQNDPLSQARAAITRGADPAAVRARLRSMGIDAGGL